MVKVWSEAYCYDASSDGGKFQIFQFSGGWDQINIFGNFVPKRHFWAYLGLKCLILDTYWHVEVQLRLLVITVYPDLLNF